MAFRKLHDNNQHHFEWTDTGQGPARLLLLLAAPVGQIALQAVQGTLL
jgi:hypothetical protein